MKTVSILCGHSVFSKGLENELQNAGHLLQVFPQLLIHRLYKNTYFLLTLWHEFCLVMVSLSKGCLKHQNKVNMCLLLSK